MKIYLLVQASHGENLVQLEDTKVFKTKKEAIAALKAAYREIKSWFEEEDLECHYSASEGVYSVIANDDETLSGYSAYMGCIEVKEI